MTSEITEPRPIPVHVTGADVSLAPAAPVKPRKVRKITCRTFILTASQRVSQILVEDLTRREAYVQVSGADVVLCGDKGQAGDPANITTGLPAPNGTFLSHTNTAPWPLRTTGALWAASPAAANALVAVTIVNEADA
jgi:hypothetical protein